MPAPAWNDTFTDESEWDYVSFVNAFVGAISERRQAVGLSALTPVAVDDPVDLASLWSNLQSSLITMFNMGRTDTGTGHPQKCFVHTDVDPESTPIPLASLDYWTLDEGWDAIGRSSTPWFQRKRARRIASTSATIDSENNTCAAGMHAILTAVGTNRGRVHVYNGSTWSCEGASRTISSITRVGTTATITTSTSHGFSVGEVVQISGATSGYNGNRAVRSVPSSTTFTVRVAGSPTSPTTGGSCKMIVHSPPDTLDTDLPAPYTIFQNPFTLPFTGVMQVDDYIGPWVFTQIRDLANLLKWSLWGSPLTVTRSWRQGFSTGPGHATPADAYADALASWNSSSYAANSNATFTGVRIGRSSGGLYSATIERSKIDVTGTLPDHCHRKVVGLIYVEPRTGSSSDSWTFDAQGDTDFGSNALTDGDIRKYGEAGPDAVAAINLPFDPQATVPANYADGPGTGFNNNYVGYRNSRKGVDYPFNPMMLLKWDVDDGFQYLPP